MQPLVLQLQAECLDPSASILDVLRRALVVARKLSLEDAQEWIGRELNGYKKGDTAPPYRVVKSQIMARDRYQGWIPIIFINDPTAAELLSECFVGQPVGELEVVLKSSGDTLALPFDPEMEQQVMKGIRGRAQPTRHISKAAVAGVIDGVRNTVLDWSLQLEKDGILGEGLVFSAKEKEVAAHANYTINYNAPVSQSQIQQNSPHAMQIMNVSEIDTKALAEFVKTLKDHAPELNLDVAGDAKLDTEIQQIETQIALPQPNSGVVRESLRTIRNVLEGCAGSLIASGLLYELGKFLQ